MIERKPYQLMTIGLTDKVVEVISYPEDGMVFARLIPGQPLSARRVPYKALHPLSLERYNMIVRSLQRYTDEVAHDSPR